MEASLQKLNRQIEGEVRWDPFARNIYSVDASLYQIEPVAIVLPKHRDDVLAAVSFAKEQGLPVIPRGAATGIAGGCIGPGLIIDLARYMNRILKLNCEEEYAVVEPGVVQDQLNAAVADHGQRFGPDTSTGNRATIGGMLGNNSAGAHSRRYGKTVDNVIGAALILSSGERLALGELGKKLLRQKLKGNDAEARIYQQAETIRRTMAAEIRARFPKIQRRVSGYNLDELLTDNVNLTKLVCGSEGTLGIATAIKVKLSHSPQATGLCVLHFDDLIEGLKTVPFILEHQPFALELLDDYVIGMGRASPAMAGKLDWLEGTPNGLLIAEFDGESETELVSKLDKFEADCRKHKIASRRTRLLDQADIDNVWELRKAGLGLMLSRRSREKALAFLEDSAVPPEKVGDFMAEFREYMQRTGKEVGFYGHAGVGLIHVRPMLDLHQEADLALMVKMMEDVSDMLLAYGGALSGEHGDGLVRSWLIKKMFGPKIYQAFRELKAAFDPDNRMNPGKIVDAPSPRENLRVDPSTQEVSIPTMFDFSADGGFAFAAGMCNGDAACRQPDGLMCPSFQASQDEMHSTRARATALQAVLHGKMPLENFTSEGLYKVMELCLQCKGCKRECPSQVDMARMKSEFLHHYTTEHGVALRSRIFASIDRLSRLASPVAPLANWFMTSPLYKLFAAAVGISTKREPPLFARERFSAWFRKRGGSTPGAGPKVALFTDTFTEFNYPEIGRAAVKVFEALGCDLRVPKYTCCGRPAISKGLLDEARAKARKVLARYLPLVEDGCQIVGLEPSCILTFRDELPGLLPGPEARKLAAAALTLDEFLDQLLQAGKLKLNWNKQPAKVLLHGHCHQKAQVGTGPTLNVLRAVSGFEVSEIDSGCCGMAGTFGYETEHYEFSLAVGEQRLFPAIRASSPDTIIVADGLSCRAQIEHGTGRKARHLAEVLADALAGPE